MSINPEKLIITPLRPEFAKPAKPEGYHNGYASKPNELHHQTIANIAKALLEYAYDLKNTRVFFDILDKHETCLTFNVHANDDYEALNTAIAPDFDAIGQFIKDMSNAVKDKGGLSVVEVRADSDKDKTLEPPLVAYDIREVLPAMRKIAADKMDHCQNSKIWLCGLINDLQVELKREANPHLPEFNL